MDVLTSACVKVSRQTSTSSFQYLTGGCTKKKRRGERNYADKKKTPIINMLTGGSGLVRVCLEHPTFKDGCTSFTIQKKLEHFPFTLKHFSII